MDDEAIPLGVPPWPMWVDIRPTWRGLRWEGEYGYGLARVGRGGYGRVGLPFVRWGRLGGHRLLAGFLDRHTARHGPPPTRALGVVNFRRWTP